ncbi:MAG TPA: hypothetical protein VHM70_20755 [Polyangiaceae bacterium]|jgi:hypothetical protein|nr:hypothetical protein [Polyangiaceae bacterium]
MIAQGDGWALGWCPPVLFTLVTRVPTDAEFARLLQAVLADIDGWSSTEQRSVLHHLPVASQLTARQRQLISAELSKREDQLRRICCGYALCTDSALTRGLLRVINWLAPPPYPTYNAATVLQGLRALVATDKRVDPEDLEARYRALFVNPLRALEPDQG